MPNHITNIIEFKGLESKIKELREFIKGTGDDGKEILFDFNKIIPQPESMRISADSNSEMLENLLFGTKKEFDFLSPEEKQQRALDMFRKRRADFNESLRIALIRRENIENHGHQTWYEWNIENWGTKWNAYDITEENGKIKFNTAWSCPIPVFLALSKKFPEIEIMVEYADEDIGSNAGILLFKNGEESYHLDRSGDREWCCKIKGYDWEEYQADLAE